MSSDRPFSAATHEELLALSDQAARRVMNTQGTKSGQGVGWLMMATILVESWDIYSISFLLVFIKHDFHPSALLLGLTSSAVQLGGLFGAIFGGWLADRLGRRWVFISTMVLFVILAPLQGFVTAMWQLVIIRFLLGFPLSSDLASGYAYIMEAMPRGKREVMGNRKQAMFAVGEVLAIAVITVMMIAGVDHSLLWRIGLALGAVPALFLLLGRMNITDTAPSLILRGKFHQAKQVSQVMFHDPLDMLPDRDYRIKRPSTANFLKSIWSDPVRRRASVFGWISNAAQTASFGAFGFYLPTVLGLAGFSKDPIGTNLMTGAIYCLAAVSGFIGPQITSRIGHRGIAQWGFGISFVSLLVAAIAIQANFGIVLLIAAAAMMWGQYWAGTNGMTVTAMVAPTRYKATACGFGYIFVKLGSAVTLFLFPVLLEAVGTAGATAIVSLIALAGFLAARYILPEVYGYVEAEHMSVSRIAA
ncbi:MFS transporter [Fodinicola acaciae]|uniref:MFS transporter n=1 Tax=Fodinicola acaciae TaxID=2681555 RepID=UPI0013D6C273|nr:MFS transporter [Fodinicola acaciae]